MKLSLNQSVPVIIGLRNATGVVIDKIIVPAVISGFYTHPELGKIVEVTFPSSRKRLVTESQIPSTILTKELVKESVTEMEF